MVTEIKLPPTMNRPEWKEIGDRLIDRIKRQKDFMKALELWSISPL